MEVFLFLLTFLGLGYLILHLYKKLFLPSQRIRGKLLRQGIQGPPPCNFLYGNVPEMKQIQATAILKSSLDDRNGSPQVITHDYSSTIFPYFEQWRKLYGLVYTYSTGLKQHLYVNDPELVKEMNQSITLDLGKPIYLSERLEPVFGSGITRSNGHMWAQQRKIIAPEFFMDKVKSMVGLMVESTQPLMKKWEECIESEGGFQAEIKVDEDLRGLSADVIARACFGSSYSKGKEIFSKLRSLQKLLTTHGLLFGLPSFRFYPDKNGREISNLKREIETLIWDTVKERERQSLETCSVEKDLLQLILEGAVNDNNVVGDMSPKSFIVDNCKTMYFSGHESTAIAASWCLMLLASHPEWQSRVREEVARSCKDGLLDANAISGFKTVNMVIQEAMRLYPPGAFVSREALADVQIGNIKVPKGVCVWTFIPTLHKDPTIWGPDAHEFRPERFADGVSKACKYPQAYVPFGLGTRLCLGKHFATTELKVVLSLIVSKFSFSLSPMYRHSPAFRMLVEPEHGVRILIQKV